MMNIVFYRCEICGNMVVLFKIGGGTLTCCEQAMIKLEANTTDASKEKHVPAITSENGKIAVSIGSVLHPMTPEHYIEWITLDAGDKIEIVRLQPGMEPKAEFGDANKGTVYAYCNIHGLWKADC